MLSKGNIVASHLMGLGLIPGQVSFPGSGFSSTVEFVCYFQSVEYILRNSSRKSAPIVSRNGMTSLTGMRMHSSREGVCGNNAVQFQSCDGSNYCIALEVNGCTDIVSHQCC